MTKVCPSPSRTRAVSGAMAVPSGAMNGSGEKLAMTATQAGGQGKDGRGQRFGNNQTKGGANEHTFPIVSLCRITLAPRHIYKGYEQADVRQSKEQARTPRPAPPQFAAVNRPSRKREQQD